MILSRISSRFPFGRVGLALSLLILIGLVLMLGLRGAVKPNTIGIVSASNLPDSNYGELVSWTTPGYSENFTNWILHTDPTTTAQLSYNTTQLDMHGSFLRAESPTSVLLVKSAIVDISSFPILEARINVNTGVGYGIRFFSRYSNGTQYSVWWEGSALDHRPGTGYESLRVNMQRQAFLATGHRVTELTALEIYVEVPAKTQANFQLQLLGLDFVNETLAPLTGSGQYRAVYLQLGDIGYNNASWALNRINIGVTLTANPGSTYSVYLFNLDAVSTSSTSQGLPYYTSTSSSEITFYPNQDVVLFPELLPPWSSSIVFVAGTGFFESFHVNYVNLIFLPTQADIPVLSAQSMGFYYSYFLFFLFLLPVGVALLIFQHFIHFTSVSRTSIGVALAIGLACRFALAAVTAHIFDTVTYLASARAWFQYGNPSGSLGPTLPVTFFLYWMGYSPYALFQTLGFQDIPLLGHPAGIVESVFIKMFPILSDSVVFLFLLRFKNDGKMFVWSSFYFLNPLSICISGVWGQYEAATIALVVLGIYALHHHHTAWGGLPFVVSGILQLFGFIPYVFLLLATAWSKKWRVASVLLAILAMVFVYPPETSLLYRLLLTFLGITHTLTYGSPGLYTLIGSFNSLRFLSRFHPLIFSASVILAGVLYSNYLHRFSLNSVVLYSGLSTVSFELFTGPVASWLWLLPIAILYAMFKGRDSLAAMTLPFGTAIAFTIVSHLTGSAYFLLGNVGYSILPAIESVKNGLEIFTVTATFAALMFLYFFLRNNRTSPGRTLFVTSSLILCSYWLTYFWLR